MAKHQNIRLKKSLGQHFLTNQEILLKIYNAIEAHCYGLALLEVGPGSGALSNLLKHKDKYKLVEFDDRWAEFLPNEFPELKGNVINEDFLNYDLNLPFDEEYAVVGNFPYNISSQIIFKVLDYKEKVPVCLGMFQKEVARRIASKEGSKEYGILSVLTQLFYEVEYLFDVPREAFNPPPKVISGVMVMKRRSVDFDVNAAFFKSIVKIAFGQRRKTLRNSLKQFITNEEVKNLEVFDKRPEQLSLGAFINLSNILESQQ